MNDCRCADLDVGTRLDASALPASWRHEGSTGHTLQGGDWYGEHSYVCAVCGVRFELVEYEDSPERRTISARSAPEPPPPPPSAPRLEYAGTWRDPRGRCLVIHRVGAAYEVDYLGSDGKPFSRALLDGSGASLAMPTSRDGDALRVELGSPGLGPTLELVLDGEGGQRLACRLGLGLYDDLEPDLGVPWALPLESFTRE